MDVKPENFVHVGPKENQVLKAIDFGGGRLLPDQAAADSAQPQFLEKVTATRRYMAPEMDAYFLSGLDRNIGVAVNERVCLSI